MTTTAAEVEVPAELRGTQHREFTVRASDEGDRTFTGIAVPYDVEIDVWGVRESIAPGAVDPAENVLVLYRHNQPIGRITAHRDTPTGWEVTGVLSRTPTGDEVYTLMRDGVLDRMSIGFEPVTDEITRHDDGTVTVRRVEINVREVSLVPFPAYDDARVSAVRHNPDKENTMTSSTLTPDAATIPVEVREQIDDHERQLKALLARDPHDGEQPTVEHRCAAQLIKDAISGDETALAALNEVQSRAYNPDGGVLADTVARNPWVGDLTRLVEGANPLGAIFATGPLPAEGTTIEFGVLDTDTTQVTDVTEGDDLAYGKVTVKVDTAAVRTFGGYTEYTRKAIERSSVAIIQHALRALALATGRYEAGNLRTSFWTARTAQATAGNTVAVPAAGTATYTDWLEAIVDAAVKYEDLGLPITALVVDTTTFKEFAGFTAADGRPLFTVSGTGANVAGSLNLTALQGDLASLPVRLSAKQTTPGATFVNGDAIRIYSSGLVQLQDENIINLSKQWSLYKYAATAVEIPAAIVPVARA